MSSIQVVSEYANVRRLAPLPAEAKNWAIPAKPEPLHVDKHVKGPCTIKFRDEGLKSPRNVKFRDTEEMLQFMHKESDKKLAPYRFPDQDSFKNVAKQTSRGMWSQEFVRRVQKLNPRLFIQDSKNAPGCAGWYTMKHGRLTYLNCSFRHGFIPEFAIMKADKADLVTEFEYGWRGICVMRLLKQGYLKWNAIIQEFGDVPFTDERGKWWWINTREFRN